MLHASRMRLKGLLIAVLYLGSVTATLFVAAGRLDWLMGWATTGVLALISVAITLLADPELVGERSEVRAGTRREDVVLAALSFLFLSPAALAVAGLDVGRFRWSPPMPPAVQLV